MSTEELLTYLLTPVAQVAIIVALAELVKKLGLDKRYIPLVDLALGVLSGVLINVIYMGMNWIEGIVIGTALGLSACGLFSGVKNVSEKIKENQND